MNGTQGLSVLGGCCPCEQHPSLRCDFLIPAYYTQFCSALSTHHLLKHRAMNTTLTEAQVTGHVLSGHPPETYLR